MGSSSKEDTASDGDTASGGASPSNDGRLFTEGERVLAYHGPRVYGAKIQKVELRKKEWKYFVHYLGWNKNWDEWVSADRLLKHTEENLVKQKALDKKQGVEKGAKSGRSAQTKTRSSADTKAEKDDTKNNAAKGKKRKNESGNEKDNVSADKLLKIQMPATLKKQLVDDWENVTQKDKVVKLPRSPTVDEILSKYLEIKTKKDGMITDAVGEILKGIRCYFDKALPMMLLYKRERQQYEEAIVDDISPSTVYGAEHLLRLFVKFPELFSYVNMEEETWNRTTAMNRLRWVGEGDIWELDMSTPVTLEATARAVSDDPLPLGLSRGTRLSRPKQAEFFHRFMATPLIPSFSPLHGGFSLQKVLTFPFPNNWFVSLLGQFDVQRFVSEVKKSEAFVRGSASRLSTLGKHLKDKSLYALGFCSELLLTPEDTLLLSFDSYKCDLKNNPRAKAVFNHKFPLHNLTAEAVWPGLFVDKDGEYWDVPLSMAIDLASLPAESGLSYHLCLHHNSGSPKKFSSDDDVEVAPPASLLPGLSLKSAFSYRANMDLWRGITPKLENCKPYDIFLSSPHVSVSGIIGSVMTAAFGENSIRTKLEKDSEGVGGFSLHLPSVNSGFMADALGRASLTAQYGNFQKLFFDLTRFHARLDFPHGLRFLTGATSVAQELLNSRQPSLEAFQKICPEVAVSLQQQIVGPFSLRAESGIQIDLKNGANPVTVNNTVFAIEYALQVLGSAKAVAWYSPKQKEFMVELRFYET